MNIKKPEARKEHGAIWIANDPSCSMQPSGHVFKPADRPADAALL